MGKLHSNPGKNGFSRGFFLQEAVGPPGPWRNPAQIQGKMAFPPDFSSQTMAKIHLNLGKCLFQKVFPSGIYSSTQGMGNSCSKPGIKTLFQLIFPSWEHPSHWIRGKILFKTRGNQFPTFLFLQNYGKNPAQNEGKWFFPGYFSCLDTQVMDKKCSKIGKNGFSRLFFRLFFPPGSCPATESREKSHSKIEKIGFSKWFFLLSQGTRHTQIPGKTPQKAGIQIQERNFLGILLLLDVFPVFFLNP